MEPAWELAFLVLMGLPWLILGLVVLAKTDVLQAFQVKLAERVDKWRLGFVPSMVQFSRSRGMYWFLKLWGVAAIAMATLAIVEGLYKFASAP